jgi:hypothetical protein
MKKGKASAKPKMGGGSTPAAIPKQTGGTTKGLKATTGGKKGKC